MEKTFIQHMELALINIKGHSKETTDYILDGNYLDSDVILLNLTEITESAKTVQRILNIVKG